jgi:hypothetical protein
MPLVLVVFVPLTKDQFMGTILLMSDVSPLAAAAAAAGGGASAAAGGGCKGGVLITLVLLLVRGREERLEVG